MCRVCSAAESCRVRADDDIAVARERNTRLMHFCAAKAGGLGLANRVGAVVLVPHADPGRDARRGSACGTSTTAPTRSARPSPPALAAQKCTNGRRARARRLRRALPGRGRIRGAEQTWRTRWAQPRALSLRDPGRRRASAWRGRTSPTCAAPSTTSPAVPRWIARLGCYGHSWARPTPGWWGRGNRG